MTACWPTSTTKKTTCDHCSISRGRSRLRSPDRPAAVPPRRRSPANWPGLRPGAAAEDDRAVLAGVARGLLGDLHGRELLRIRGAPHLDGGAAAGADGERARGDQLQVAGGAVPAGVPAFVELPGGQALQVADRHADRPAAAGLVGVGLPG